MVHDSLYHVLCDSQFRLHFDLYLQDSDVARLIQTEQCIYNLFKQQPYYAKYAFLLPQNDGDPLHLSCTIALADIPSECKPFVTRKRYGIQMIGFLQNDIKSCVRAVSHKHIVLHGLFLDCKTEFTNEDGSWSHPLIVLNGCRAIGKTWTIHNLMRNMKDLFVRMYIVTSLPTSILQTPQCHRLVPPTMEELQLIHHEREQNPEGNWLLVYEDLQLYDHSTHNVVQFIINECKSKRITVIYSSTYITSTHPCLRMTRDVWLQFYDYRLIDNQYIDYFRQQFGDLSFNQVKQRMESFCDGRRGHLLVSSTRTSRFYIVPDDYSAPFVFPNIARTGTVLPQSEGLQI